MCGGGCGDSGGCGYFVANILYISERLASCCAATAVVVCLVLTLIIMLALGVGLGYNYCIVGTKLLDAPPEPLEGDETSPSTPPTTPLTTPPPPPPPSMGRRKRDIESFPTESSATENLILIEDADIKPTMVIPLRKYDFQSLLAKLRKNNRNVTLEIIQ